MLDSITFKTELGEIITPEEVAILFDYITKKYSTELVSLSIFPQFNKLRGEVLDKTIKQRNSELSKLLAEIATRKQEIKISMWQVLSVIGNNKKILENDASMQSELEQIIYEEEQIINVYENSIKALENKEKKIMNGKYSRLDKVSALPKRKALKRQLEELEKKLLLISRKHDNCFDEFKDKIEVLIENTIISSNTTFPNSKKKLATPTITAEQYANSQSMTIEDTDYYNPDDNKMNYKRKHEFKDFYIYEPNEEDLDDELIYQLLAQGKYDENEGTINGLSIMTEYELFEEA